MSGGYLGLNWVPLGATSSYSLNFEAYVVVCLISARMASYYRILLYPVCFACQYLYRVMKFAPLTLVNTYLLPVTFLRSKARNVLLIRYFLSRSYTTRLFVGREQSTEYCKTCFIAAPGWHPSNHCSVRIVAKDALPVGTSRVANTLLPYVLPITPLLLPLFV